MPSALPDHADREQASQDRTEDDCIFSFKPLNQEKIEIRHEKSQRKLMSFWQSGDANLLIFSFFIPLDIPSFIIILANIWDINN